jgi:hypothetical protein
MAESAVPERATFLAAPAEVVAAVAPPTAVWALGGTRRRATIAGIPLDESYIEWSRREMITAIALFFQLGVRHLIVPSLGPNQTAEVGRYGKEIIAWTIEALTGPTMLEEYRRRGWRARYIVPSPVPDLRAAAARLIQEPAPADAPTVWFYFVAEHGDPWEDLLAAVHRSGARTYAAAQQAVYGEEIPPATLLVGFGKPVVGTTLVPPLLCGPAVQCYWTQRAGMRLTEPMLREILYDYAYTRHTFRPDRQGRYDQAAAQQALWDTEAVLGVGVGLDGFWYPAPFPGAQR